MDDPILVTRILPTRRAEVVFTSPKRDFELAWDGQKHFFLVDGTVSNHELTAEFFCDDTVYGPVCQNHSERYLAYATNSGVLSLSSKSLEPPFFLTTRNDVMFNTIVVELTRHASVLWDLADAKAYHCLQLLMNERAKRFRGGPTVFSRIEDAESETAKAMQAEFLATRLTPGLFLPCVVQSNAAVLKIVSLKPKAIKAQLYFLSTSNCKVRIGAFVQRTATVDTIEQGCHFEAMIGEIQRVSSTE